MLNFNEFWNLYAKGNVSDILKMINRVASEDNFIKMVDSILITFLGDDDSFLFKTGRMSVIERKLI